MRKMKKIFALCLLFSFTVNTAYAGGGATGGATEITQKLNNIELVAQVQKATEQVTQLYEQIEQLYTQIDDMLHNTLQLPDQLFRSIGNITALYGKVKGIIDKTQGLAYNLANLDDELKNRFKSYADLSSLRSSADFASEYREIAETQMETTRSTMEAIGVAMEELTTSDASALEELQKKAQSADGRNQLIQATNQFLGFLAEDAMKLRHTQMMQTQMMGTAMEAERARDDAQQKKHEILFAPIELNRNVDTSDTVEDLMNW